MVTAQCPRSTNTSKIIICIALAAQVACGGDRTLAVCQHEVRDAEARGAADRRLLGSWCAAATVLPACSQAAFLHHDPDVPRGACGQGSAHSRDMCSSCVTGRSGGRR
jgi:hypothetical protein